MFRIFSLEFLLVLTLLAVPAAADFEFDFETSHYRVVTTNQNFDDAAAAAVATQFNGIAGSLARIDSQAENDAIAAALFANISPSEFSNTVAPDGGGGSYVWLGGTDRDSEGVWIWDGDGDGVGDQFWAGDEDGSAVGGLYNNFGTTASQNEPDNFGAGQDGLGISLNGWPLGSASQWNDVSDANDLYFLIEFENANPMCLLGDVNLDGEVNLLDVSSFVTAVTRGTFSCEADANEDGNVDLLDVAPFVMLLTGQ